MISRQVRMGHSIRFERWKRLMYEMYGGQVWLIPTVCLLMPEEIEIWMVRNVFHYLFIRYISSFDVRQWFGLLTLFPCRCTLMMIWWFFCANRFFTIIIIIFRFHSFDAFRSHLMIMTNCVATDKNSGELYYGHWAYANGIDRPPFSGPTIIFDCFQFNF